MKYGQKVAVLGCGAVLFFAGCKTTESDVAREGEVVSAEQQEGLMPARVMEAIEARVAAGEYPAIVVAVSAGGRSQVYSFGEFVDGKVADGDTLFEIGSVTKTFTATLLARAVVEDRVKLDDPVAAVVPDLKLPTGPDGRAFTLGELASQYSGLPRLADNMTGVDGDNPYARYGLGEMKEFLAGYKMTREPGSSYEYSNLGYGLLGYAMGELAGSSYSDAVAAQIFEPLGMTHSAVHRLNADQANLAAGHKPHGGGEVGGWDFDVFAGAGSIVSSGNDMLRYLEANMQAQQVDASSAELLRAMQLAHKPLVDGPAAGQRTGLAWIEQALGNEKIIFHNGMTGGFASFTGFTSDGNRGVVVLTNVQASVDDLGLALLGDEKPLRAARTSYVMSAEERAEYEGSYLLGGNAVLRVFEDQGQMYIQLTGQGPLPVFARAKDVFFATIAEIEVVFARDESGQIDALILHQHGEHRLPRISEEEVDKLRNRAEVKLSAEQLAGYVGRYQVDPKLAPGLEFDVTLEGDVLHVRLSGQSANPVYASAVDSFFYRVVDATIQFERDDKGAVKGLVLYQGGQQIPAARVGSESEGGAKK